MIKNLFKYYGFLWLLLVGCECGDALETNNPPTSLEPYNLEAIDLGIPEAEQQGLSFSFNSRTLVKEGDVYRSEDMIVYQKDQSWKATIIGPGGIKSSLKISNQAGLMKEIGITTTSKVFGYQDNLGPEWPGMKNIGNTCFANSVYKLIARCPGFDQALSKDEAGGIHTALRNIVNGIRLGKKSAFEQSHIQGEMSKLFLQSISAKLKSKYDDGQQHDGAELIEHIFNTFYSGSVMCTNDPKELEGWIGRPATDPFNSLYKDLENGCYFYGSWSQFCQPCLDTKVQRFIKLPQFMGVLVGSSTGTQQDHTMKEVLKIPLYDKDDKQLGEKTYQLIGLIQHSGSSPSSGHYIAYINFNVHGWYKQNDSSVSLVTLPSVIKSLGWLGLYELQD